VAIRKVGVWDVSDSPADLDEYLRTQGADGYPVTDVRHSLCSACGGTVFMMRCADAAVERTCRACGTVAWIADSKQFWDEEEAAIFVCDQCTDDVVEDCAIAVGFSVTGDGVQSLAVASRCANCGRLGCCAEWTLHGGELDLMDLV
jgi:hypothetical protein